MTFVTRPEVTATSLEVHGQLVLNIDDSGVVFDHFSRKSPSAIELGKSRSLALETIITQYITN